MQNTWMFTVKDHREITETFARNREPVCLGSCGGLTGVTLQLGIEDKEVGSVVPGLQGQEHAGIKFLWQWTKFCLRC